MDTTTAVRLAAFLFFAAWLLLTLLAQSGGGVGAGVRSHDLFALLPSYTFFAPRPPNCDLCLTFRDVDAAGEPGPWKTVWTIPPRRLVHAVWNPVRRPHHVLLIFTSCLPAEPGPELLRMFRNSVAYYAVLNAVLRLPASPLACRRQFRFLAVLRTPQGKLETKTLFLSEQHRVPEEAHKRSGSCPTFPVLEGGPLP
jgi:hypothetical protein